MEECSEMVQKASTYDALCKRDTYIGKVREVSSNGVMDKCSGTVQQASAHSLRTHENQTEHVRETSSNGVMDEHSGKAQGEHSRRGPW